MTLYFAYGSNMSRAPMRARCAGAQEIGVGRLQDHRFIIMQNGYASVLRAPGAVVHGLVWRITPRDLAALNAYESVDSGLYRRATLPVAIGDKTARALVYLGGEEREGRPRPGHVELVVDAARECGLPDDYVASLERWSPGGFRGARAVETGEIA